MDGEMLTAESDPAFLYVSVADGVQAVLVGPVGGRGRQAPQKAAPETVRMDGGACPSWLWTRR